MAFRTLKAKRDSNLCHLTFNLSDRPLVAASAIRGGKSVDSYLAKYFTRCLGALFVGKLQMMY